MFHNKFDKPVLLLLVVMVFLCFILQYIENLDRMKRLQVLILSNNIIEKIERLDKLLKLKELDISNNSIVKIEGLENLSNLQILNVSGNLIEHIPIWMGKRLKSLRAFLVGRNRLESVSTQKCLNCHWLSWFSLFIFQYTRMSLVWKHLPLFSQEYSFMIVST